MSDSRCFQPGEGPSRGLLRDCTTSPINRLQHYHAPLLTSQSCGCRSWSWMDLKHSVQRKLTDFTDIHVSVECMCPYKMCSAMCTMECTFLLTLVDVLEVRRLSQNTIMMFKWGGWVTGVNTRLLRNVQLLIDHWRLLPLGVTGLQHVYVTCVNIGIVHSILAVLQVNLLSDELNILK